MRKVEIDNTNVIAESVKLADNGGVIVRLYNSAESEQSVNVSVADFEKVETVNILE